MSKLFNSPPPANPLYLQTHPRTWKQDSQRFRTPIESTLGHLRLTDITVAQVLQLRLSQGSKGRSLLAPATCNRALALLKTVGAHALRLDLVMVNQAAKIPLLQENNIRTRFLGLDEYQFCLDHETESYITRIHGIFYCDRCICLTRWLSVGRLLLMTIQHYQIACFSSDKPERVE